MLHKQSMEHIFTPDERREHLTELATALDLVRQALSETPSLQNYISSIEASEERINELLRDGFIQADLTDLANALPDPLGMRGNPRWEPPLVQTAVGEWQIAEWFRPIQARLEAMNAAAAKLRAVGFY